MSDSNGNGGGGGAGYYGGFGGTTHSGADASGAGGSGYVNRDLTISRVNGINSETYFGADGASGYKLAKHPYMGINKELGNKRGPSADLGNANQHGFVLIYAYCDVYDVLTPTPTPSKSIHSKLSYSKSISISKTPTPSQSRQYLIKSWVNQKVIHIHLHHLIAQNRTFL